MIKLIDYFSGFLKNSSISEGYFENKENCFVLIPDEILLKFMHSMTLSSVSNFAISCKKFNNLSNNENLPFDIKISQTIFKNIFKLPTSSYIEIRNIDIYANYFGKIDSAEKISLFLIYNNIGIDNDTPLGAHSFRLHRKLIEIPAENKNKFLSFIILLRKFKVLSVDIEETNENMTNKVKASLDLAIAELNATYTS